MRITNNMMTYNFLGSLNKSLEKTSEIQEQLSDGKSIHRPSDDPVKAVRSLYFTTSKDQNTQFTQNLGDAQSWMNSSDKVMSDLSTVMIKLQELVVSADDTKNTDDVNAIGRQVDEMINQVVALGNTKVGERYLFGGQNDSVIPFVRRTVTDAQSGLTKDIVEYNGDLNKISMVMQPGPVNSMQDSVNLTGVEVFGPATNTLGHQTLAIFDHMIEMKNEMLKRSSVSQTNSSGGIGTVSGKYTGPGYKSFDLRIDGVDGTGQVTDASYSNDGGNTWTTAPAFVAGDPSVIALGDGVSFSITASLNNTAHTAGSNGDVYSFRAPQDEFAVAKTNTSGGTATVLGTYSKSGTTSYSVKIGKEVPVMDPITGLQKTDPETGKPMTQVTGGVDAAGNVTDVLVSTDKGVTWSAATIAGGIISMPNDTVKLQIAPTTSNRTNDVYSFALPQGNGADAKWLSGIATDYVEKDHNAQLKVHTELGARMSMYQMANNMMIDQAAIIETDQGNNDGLNIPKAITDFNIIQNVYRSSLAIGAKILPPSLVDFLS